MSQMEIYQPHLFLQLRRFRTCCTFTFARQSSQHPTAGGRTSWPSRCVPNITMFGTLPGTFWFQGSTQECFMFGPMKSFQDASKKQLANVMEARSKKGQSRDISLPCLHTWPKWLGRVSGTISPFFWEFYPPTQSNSYFKLFQLHIVLGKLGPQNYQKPQQS